MKNKCFFVKLNFQYPISWILGFSKVYIAYGEYNISLHQTNNFISRRIYTETITFFLNSTVEGQYTVSFFLFGRCHFIILYALILLS